MKLNIKHVKQFVDLDIDKLQPKVTKFMCYASEEKPSDFRMVRFTY